MTSGKTIFALYVLFLALWVEFLTRLVRRYGC